MEYGAGIPSGDPGTGNLVDAEWQYWDDHADLHLAGGLGFNLVLPAGGRTLRKCAQDLVFCCTGKLLFRDGKLCGYTKHYTEPWSTYLESTDLE